MVFNTGPYTVLPDNSILITANMQSETGFPSNHQLKSYVASKSRLKLAARCPVSGCWPSCLLSRGLSHGSSAGPGRVRPGRALITTNRNRPGRQKRRTHMARPGTNLAGRDSCKPLQSTGVHRRLLWPPYGIGQAIIFLPCGFYLSFYLSFFLA